MRNSYCYKVNYDKEESKKKKKRLFKFYHSEIFIVNVSVTMISYMF